MADVNKSLVSGETPADSKPWTNTDSMKIITEQLNVLRAFITKMDKEISVSASPCNGTPSGPVNEKPLSIAEAIKASLEKQQLLSEDHSITAVEPGTAKHRVYHYKSVNVPCPNNGPDFVYHDWRGDDMDVLLHTDESRITLYSINATLLATGESNMFGSNSPDAAAKMVQHLLQYGVLRYTSSWDSSSESSTKESQ